jgi:adenine-specific DNA-methyltransferase
MSLEIKQKIATTLADFQTNNLFDNGIALFKALGYNTERQQKLSNPTYKTFKEAFVDGNTKSFNEKKALVQNWNEVHLLFQLTKAELTNQGILFDTKKVDNTIIEAYLFFAIELDSTDYTRTHLSEITREINKLFPMPVMVLFKLNDKLTLSVINRRLHKNDNSKDVLEKITLIKDIDIVTPHRGHIEILFDLNFQELYNNFQFDSFVSLHNAWQKTLDTNELNKKFYQKLFNWYLWATTKVNFPQIRPEEDKISNDVHQSESLIRLLSRILFCWFMKEKGLINSKLFDTKYLKKTLRNFEGNNSEETIYYKAILQNLFFATLNKPIDERKIIDKGYNKKEYGDPLIYRYEDLFIDNQTVLSHFENIPFLNGGLFDCLDQKKDKDNPTEIRLDGFSTNPAKQPIMPDMLFFGEYKGIDLSKEYDDKRKSKVTVFGLLDILNDYKFTIEENTPLEEEIALDPELLGKVFENLLASYNPETKTTARKQTGSFYTPREIVNYMVDESLIAYLKNKLDDEGRLRNLFSYKEIHNPFDTKETKTLIESINAVKILDPACGSGAFPMGVLQKLIHVLHKLDPENKIWFELVIANFPAAMQNVARQRLEKENWNFVRKLGIIQECIYGVDIQPIAIQISKLRFFISLLVDQTEKPNEVNRGFEPLPNLDFKLVAANTLIGAPESTEVLTGLFADQKDDFFEEFDELTNEFFNIHLPEEKKTKKQALLKLIDSKISEKKKSLQRAIDVNNTKQKEAGETQIKLWSSYGNLFKHESVGFFETKYFFPKVKDGFDVVIGNPPYGNLFKEKSVFKYMSDNFDTAEYKIDAYSLFVEKGLKLCKLNGGLSYIIPYTFLSGIYFSKLRTYINSNNLSTLIVLGKKIFQAADVDTCIVLVNKNNNDDRVKVADFRQKNALNEIIDFQVDLIEKNKLLHNYKELICVGTQEQIDLYIKIKENKKNLSNHLTFYHGIQSRGDDKAIVSEKIKDARPLLKGRDFSKYSINQEEKYFVFKPENIKSGGNLDFHLANKKIIIRTTSDSIIATIDASKYLVLNSVNIAIPNGSKLEIEHLLGIINSKLMSFWYDMTVQEFGKTFAEVKIVYLEKIPIIESKNECALIVKYLLLLNNSLPHQCTFFERLLDAIVYELYLPEAMASGGCLVLQHLSNLPSLLENNDENNLASIAVIHQELSDINHPVAKAMHFMDTIEEIAIIEGKKD